MNKNQRDEQRHQEDLALNRALVWVGAAIVLELLLLLVNKYYINVYTTEASVSMAYAFQNGLKAARIIALVGMVACGVWTWLGTKKNGIEKTPLVLTIGCAAIAFCSHVALTYQGSGLRMLFLLVPGWAALALVYYLYQHEFFLCAAYSGLGVTTLWLIRHQGTSALTTYLFLAIMVLALVVGLALVKKGSFVPKDTDPKMMYLTAGVNVAAVAAALVLGGTVAYYLMYALVACLFGLLVYYTVKMM